ncbi:hypothetical protein H6G20_01075 [Desertifilum sp. FACHB-1129]|nr:hypothetical protein [Desertifilum sp. FACHB-866]MBD2310274.1 hypothetical protein [Desertifilum sp. FACHB-1129]MBD2322650.1 hypothetical protein [Desertifilum sp. FACHB-866]MBD2333528.1 hypothetical protein [Desertifilum sp. FACHB-868]OEJ76212.1 hypothetical protein BH720_06490 [Desertifilum tharense IPPAS B-1220]
MMRRLALVSGLVVLNAFGLATVARAGEGGVAGSAAFTVNGTNVTGVAVSAAVGKQSAAAHSFNYDATNTNGLQNSAFAIGTGGLLQFTAIGDPAGFNLNTTEDPALGNPQGNTFTAGYSIRLGTQSGDVLGTSPLHP